MYLTVSIGPYGESHRVFTSPFPLRPPRRFPTFHHRTFSSLCCLHINYFFINIRTHKKIEKQIHNLPSQEMILDCRTLFLTCYPLGHWYVLQMVKPKTYNWYKIPVVKPWLHFLYLNQYSIVLSLNSITIPWNSINSLYVKTYLSCKKKCQ